MFDTSFKYRIVSNEGHCSYSDSMKFAKLLAGETIISIQASGRDGLVEIARQQGRPRRWKATLTDDGDVELSALFCDSIDIPAQDFEAARAAACAQLIDREAARRAKRDTKRDKFAPNTRKAVICINLNPPRRFKSLRAAARWLGVTPQSVWDAIQPGRNGRQKDCCHMIFKYAHQVSAAVRAAAVDHQEGEENGTQQPKLTEDRRGIRARRKAVA